MSNEEMEIRELVREALDDCPIDAERPEGESAVLLMLAMYNIAGTMEWCGDWASAVTSAFVWAGAKPPKRSSVRWYRMQLVSDPERFLGIHGVDAVLVNDLLTR